MNPQGRKVYVTEDGVRKIYLQVLIPEDLYQKLKAYAATIGNHRGAISAVVTEALRNYLENPNQPSDKSRNPHDAVLSIFKLVARMLGEESVTLLEGLKVPEDILERAIAETRGSSKKTIKEWIEKMEKLGYIKYEGGFRPRRVFRVVRIPS